MRLCRCFPHKCVQPSPSSCGTYLVMQVTGTFTSEEADSFVSFSRFEAYHDNHLDVGQQISYSTIVANAKRPGRDMGVWMRNVLEGRPPLGKPPLTYTINKNALGDPWQYAWKGGASKALRNTQHVFKVQYTSKHIYIIAI
ncbi:hypothetical protein B5M09_010577 [Aphanomyces astaci]|uniref:Uncharacterized protein n=1 Tax=Aphanomyces astaci TaxID=112090 RepID=A0A425D5J8_APHAT|nr:hypothetical protein B5M09_010577 [Aphanomyces astaci]